MRAAFLAAATCAATTAALVACGGEEKQAPSRAARAVPTAVCSPIVYGGRGRPRSLVVVAGPLQGAYSPHGLQNTQSVKLILSRRAWRADTGTVGMQACNEADARSGEPSPGKCRRIARAASRDRDVVGIVGPTFSTCAIEMLPILNRAPGGPLALISPGATYLGLTRGGPGVAREHPDALYPTGRRNFARMAPADDVSGAAIAVFAQRRGVRRPFVLNDGVAYGVGVAAAFKAAAERSGMEVAGTAAWDPRARSYARLADRIRTAGADAVFLGGYVSNNGPKLIENLRAGLGSRVEILAPDGFQQPEAIVEGAGARAEGVKLAIAALPTRALSPAGRRYAAEFEQRFGQRPCCFAVHAAEAAEILMDAIERSDGSRRRVTDEVFRTDVRDGLLGSFRVDRHGDTTSSTIAVYEIRGGKLEFVTAIAPSARLLARR